MNGTQSEIKHGITLNSRRDGTVEGVSKVVSAYPDAINIVTSKGALCISGKELKILKYDVDSGKLVFEGEVAAIKYEGGKKPLLKRIFK